MKNRKRGLNSPNKLFADWIIHGKYKPHIEGFDSECQPTLQSAATSEPAFLSHQDGVLLQLGSRLEPDEQFQLCVSINQQHVVTWRSARKIL